jgi:hypothetical protein
MNPLMAEWFRKVDMHPSMFHLEPDKEWIRRFWRTAYRDARQRAHIMDHCCTDLVNFRGFGPLKKVWARSGNCIGRVIANDLKDFDNNSIAKAKGFQDFNPSRRLGFI